jgi:hypothetical protein
VFKFVGSESNPQPKSSLMNKQQEGFKYLLDTAQAMSYFSEDQRSESCRVLAHQCGKAQFANGRSCLQASAFFTACYLQGYLIVGLEVVITRAALLLPFKKDVA